MTKTFKAGQRVMVSTHFGARRAIVVSGRVSRAGNLNVQLAYSGTHKPYTDLTGPWPTHALNCRNCYGRPKPYHVDDVRVVRRGD